MTPLAMAYCSARIVLKILPRTDVRVIGLKLHFDGTTGPPDIKIRDILAVREGIPVNVVKSCYRG